MLVRYLRIVICPAKRLWKPKTHTPKESYPCRVWRHMLIACMMFVAHNAMVYLRKGANQIVNILAFSIPTFSSPLQPAMHSCGGIPGIYLQGGRPWLKPHLALPWSHLLPYILQSCLPSSPISSSSRPNRVLATPTPRNYISVLC